MYNHYKKKKNPVLEEYERTIKSKYDPDKLRSLIEEGKTAKEIMDEFGINQTKYLKTWILNLSNIDKIWYEVPGLFNLKSRQAYVDQKGQIKILMKNIDFKNLILKPDDEFLVEVDDEENKIILTKRIFITKDVSNSE